MRRFLLIVLVVLAAAVSVGAQEVADSVDFVLRPTQTDDDPWDYWLDVAEPPRDGTIGPPLAGPTGEERIGPPLAGPTARAAENVKRRDRGEADAFAATGIRLGTFILRPSIELGISVTDNAEGTPDKQAAIGAVIAPELTIGSETERAELAAELRGVAILYGEQEFDEREGEALLRGRYELTDETALNATARYHFELERFTDPDTPAAAVERPPVHELDAALGVTQRFGRAAFALAGTVEREVHEDVELSGGGTASRKELDNTEYGLRLRGSFDVSRAFTPFVEAAGGQREFDQEVDDNGFERSSVWGELRGGLIFDLGPKLNGEVALGYRHEDLDDEALDDLDAVVARAAVLWSPRRLTEVRFDLSTETQPTSIPDAAGSVLYSGDLTISRQMTSRLRVEAGAGLDYENFVGVDRRDVTYSADVGFSYAFNRVTSLIARYVHERLDSTEPDTDSNTNTVTLRLRLQR
jgi:hypothetical protein